MTAEPHTASYYAATRNLDVRHPELEDSIEADVCICGAGFTGVATALTLAERGYSVAVLEQNRIGWGASGRNGGQLIGGFAGQARMVRRLGTEVSDAVWDMGWRGHELIEQRVAKYGIDCDLKHGYMDVALKPRHMADLRDDLDELNRRGMGDGARLVPRGEMRDLIASDAYIGGLTIPRNGHLHPLNLCLGEAAAAERLGVRFFEGSEVLAIEAGEQPVLTTAKGQVTAQAAVLAGNAYQRLLSRRLGGLVFPAGSFIIATEPLSEAEATEINPLDMAFCDPNHLLDYFRLSADRRLLFGGRCNYTGRTPKSIKDRIGPRMLKVFPQLKDKRIDFQWGGKIGIVVNRVPLIGRLEGNLYHAIGYSGHGVNMTHTTAEIVADAIGGTLERIDLFERIKHLRIPLPQSLGNWMVATGMLYFRLRDLL